MPAERLRAVPAEDGGHWSKPAADVYKNKVRQKEAPLGAELWFLILLFWVYLGSNPGPRVGKASSAPLSYSPSPTLGFRIKGKRKSLQVPAGVQSVGRADAVDSNDRIPFLGQQMDDPVWRTLYSECSERLCRVRVKAGLYTSCSHLGFVGRRWRSSWASDSSWHWISQQGPANRRLIGRAA